MVLTVFLRQRGAAHSRKPKDEKGKNRKEVQGGRLRWFGRSGSWAYGNSLSLALLGCFLASLASFVFVNRARFNHERAAAHLPPVSVETYLASARMWFELFQTWQAEFFVMAVFLVLSVFLRQDGSAESKPLESGDDETGETND